MTNKRSAFFLFLVLAGLFLLPSCVKYRHLKNFDEGPSFTPAQIAEQNPIRLQPDDLIAVSVQSVDPTVSAPYNFGGIPATGQTTTGGSIGNQESAAAGGGQTHLIDANGEINLVGLGKIRLAGLSTLQARDTLTARLRKYITDPIVNVRLLNFRFTVLGEVNNSGSYSVEKERLNILEALGMAGDLTIFGNRKNILIIREKEGVREYGYIDLHRRDVFTSPYFYLMQNDIVYVEPMRSKLAATPEEATKYLQYAFPVISVISLIISLVR
jgi:polysaccharide export outer membrane protein